MNGTSRPQIQGTDPIQEGFNEFDLGCWYGGRRGGASAWYWICKVQLSRVHITVMVQDPVPLFMESVTAYDKNRICGRYEKYADFLMEPSWLDTLSSAIHC
ncbi:MAG: hypothetical protein H6905_05100 [Hyphomicrobiales bacterium]|nr:hypothetical protein [Hyphomicrobiales bacterium]